MTLQQLRYVVQVAADGTFSAAAKRLFITQPSLTAAVRELERELGITIFTAGGARPRDLQAARSRG